ncbi:MAG: PilZ domain-containing protein [Candidatus Omnitrophota bacterium]|nr:PilZ domain-containing protein [Candidatus Omnitrophota bacterium]
MSNKRSYDRLDVMGTVDLKSQGHTYRGYLQNISFTGFGGFSVVTLEKIAPGAAVEFDINIPALGETLGGLGVVRYLSQVDKHNKGKIFILGVEFTDVNKDIVAHILRKLQIALSSGPGKGKPHGPVDFIPF